MAARRSGARHCREPKRPDRRFRPHRAEAPDRGDDGHPRSALRRRFLVPRPSCHGAVRGWAARRRRPKIERSVAANPDNAHGAHGFAHVCYESGEPDTARAYLSSWLATYPRDGFFHGHLSWHLSLCELQAGNWAEALRCIGTPLRSTGIAADRNRVCRMGRRFCGVPSSPAIPAMPRPGARCTTMRTARCRRRAAGCRPARHPGTGRHGR